MRENDVVRMAREVLSGILECSAEERAPLTDGSARPGGVFATDRHVFVIEAKRDGWEAQVGAAARQLHSYRALLPENGVLLLVVPYMGGVGKQMCTAEGISWMDLSGNADITGPGLRIRIEGRPNLFKGPGRPATQSGFHRVLIRSAIATAALNAAVMV